MRQGRRGFAALTATANEDTARDVALVHNPYADCCALVHPLERANVATHGIGFVVFVAFFAGRVAWAASAAAPSAIGPFTLVQIAAIAVSAAVFGASAVYHASSNRVVASAYLLALDRALVYASIVSSGAADFVIATMGTATPRTGCARTAPLLPDPDVPWQAYVDGPLAGAIAIGCVVAVRVTRWPATTSATVGFAHSAERDSRRPGHVAGPFDATFAVVAAACALVWICAVDYELRMLPKDVGTTVVTVKALSTAVAMLFGTNDLRETTDAYAMRLPLALRKFLPRSHTLWHVAALVVAASAIGVREWALAAQLDAAAACADRSGAR